METEEDQVLVTLHGSWRGSSISNPGHSYKWNPPPLPVHFQQRDGWVLLS